VLSHSFAFFFAFSPFVAFLLLFSFSFCSLCFFCFFFLFFLFVSNLLETWRLIVSTQKEAFCRFRNRSKLLYLRQSQGLNSRLIYLFYLFFPPFLAFVQCVQCTHLCHWPFLSAVPSDSFSLGWTQSVQNFYYRHVRGLEKQVILLASPDLYLSLLWLNSLRVNLYSFVLPRLNRSLCPHHNFRSHF
jgi:hypothetical protein